LKGPRRGYGTSQGIDCEAIEGWIRLGNRETSFLEQFEVLFDAPFRFVEAILDRMTDPRKAFEVRRIQSEEVWIGRCFDDERVFQINHAMDHFL
jgi:hypothetical protein